MPKYFCDYCDTYLTHDSPSVRKTHCSGRKHKENVKLYYQKWLEEQVQKLVDDTTAAFRAGKTPATPVAGAMIPPPSNLAGKGPPTTTPSVPPTGAPPPPTMPLMGPPGPMPPMMPGMRGPMPMGGPPMHPMMPPMAMRPMMAGPSQAKIRK